MKWTRRGVLQGSAPRHARSPPRLPYFDDTKRYIDAVAWLGAEDKRKIFSENARKVYRLDRVPRPAGRR